MCYQKLGARSPDANVVKWVNSRPPTSLYLSVLTLGELRKGIDSLADTKRRLKLVDWLKLNFLCFLLDAYWLSTKALPITGGGCWRKQAEPCLP
jgi:hypothetical protein